MYDFFLKSWLSTGIFDAKKGTRYVDLKEELKEFKNVLEEMEEYKNSFDFEFITTFEYRKEKNLYENKKE